MIRAAGGTMPEIRNRHDAHDASRAPGAVRTAPSAPAKPDDASILTFETYRKPARLETHTETVWPRHRLARLDGLLAVALFVAAIAARAPFIAKGETLLHSDEAIVGLMAQDIAAGRALPIYFYGQRYMGTLEAFTIAALLPVFENPIHALRAGPALFFAALVAAQFLMLARWFGRRGGLIGAATLICASPMFMQWSISARGAYVEILLWGTLLLWSYSEWFVHASQVDARIATRRRLVFGLLIGSGLWLNPSIVLFVLPIVLHALMHRPLFAARSHPAIGPTLCRLADTLGRATLPVVAIAAVLALNLTWAVWISDHKVRSELLLGIFPKPLTMLLYAGAGIALITWLRKHTRLLPTLRALATRNAALILGVVIGAAPAVLYTLQTAVGARPLDPSLPLGFRPIWLAGETMIYLINGLPLLFGADPRPFLQLVGTGRDTVVTPLTLMDSAAVTSANWIIAGCVLSGCIMLMHREREGLARLLRMEPDRRSPALLLMMAVATTIGLYVLGGCTLDFTTIRYLVPLWVFLPGLLAAMFVDNDRLKAAGRIVPLALCFSWGLGQFVMNRQLGAPHPLRNVADRLVADGIETAVAEPLDAHLLSYLTQQKCRTVEYESFWPRLKQYHPLVRSGRPMDYVVQTAELDRTWDWIRGGWPGEAPPETKRFLWPKLRRWMTRKPDSIAERGRLPDGYERIRLVEPLSDRTLSREIARSSKSGGTGSE